MATITINADQIVGKIKPMHGVGQPPLAGHSTKKFNYLTEAGIPYSRLHDVGGPYGGNRFVDIPNIFRNFDADENDPSSYDFTFTDLLIKGLIDAKTEPYFRLGITIETGASIKAYRTTPPKDNAKWARICEHIVRHYNEGWANGFNYNITYWEIWNEPECLDEYKPGKSMWDGVAIQYFELYDTTAKHLKKCFPYIKVGGYGSAGFIYLKDPDPEKYWQVLWYDFFFKFFDYIKEHNSPIDFFSWHSYSKTKWNIVYDSFVKENLEKFGYGHIETHLNEWHPVFEERGSAHHSAEIASTMLALQNGRTDLCCIYDMRLFGNYSAFFDGNTALPNRAYYSAVAFNELYKLQNQVELTIDVEDMYAVCATNGKKTAIMITNLTESAQSIEINGVSLEKARYYIIDQEKKFGWAYDCKQLNKNGVALIIIE